VLILTFQYHDGSAFRVCGATQNYTVARTWLAAGDGQHKVYRVDLDNIADHSKGYEEWNA